jgi:hypothetical protein
VAYSKKKGASSGAREIVFGWIRVSGSRRLPS